MYYALLIEENGGWMKLCMADDVSFKSCLGIYELQSDLCKNNEFIANIIDKPVILTNINSFDSFIYYGWYISAKEYDRIKEMIRLYPHYLKFNYLKKYE